MGLALLLMGGLGYPLMSVVQEATALSLETRTGLLVPQVLCHLVADFFFAYFTLRVFRPGVLWARVLVVAITAGVVWLALWQVAVQGLDAFVLDRHAGVWRLHGIPAMAALVWGAAESLRYHALLRRRLGLGLADPVVTDRMRLWGLGLIAAVAISAIDLVLIETTGVGLVGTRFGGILVGVLGLGAAGAIWLAFLPPDAYLRGVAARAATATS
jgi:hypothetical protein